MSIRRFNIETGETLYESDRAKPYEIRHPKGLSPDHAPVRRFQRGKPRYRHFQGLLVMGRRRSSGPKKAAAPRCPVLAFPAR
jgi:hypothetical protein